MRLLGLALGGLLGTFSRYFLTEFVRVKAGTGFPWGTMAVNGLGCFAAGILAGLFLKGRDPASPDWSLFFITGFCGAFTTFSALVLETSAMAEGGRLIASFLNVVLSLSAGFAAFAAGRGMSGILPK